MVSVIFAAMLGLLAADYVLLGRLQIGERLGYREPIPKEIQNILALGLVAFACGLLVWAGGRMVMVARQDVRITLWITGAVSLVLAYLECWILLKHWLLTRQIANGGVPELDVVAISNYVSAHLTGWLVLTLLGFKLFAAATEEVLSPQSRLERLN